VGDDGGAVIGDNHNFKAVPEGEMRDIWTAGSFARWSAWERNRGHGKGSNSESLYVMQHDWPLDSVGLSPRPGNRNYALRGGIPLRP